MYKITIIRNLHKRDEETELCFRLKDAPGVDLTYNTGVMVKMGKLAAFTLNGELQPCEEEADMELKDVIDHCRAAMGEVYSSMVQGAEEITNERFQSTVGELLRTQGVVEEDAAEEPQVPLLDRFCYYIEEERKNGTMTDRMYRECRTLSRKLDRFLKVRECEGIVPSAFTTELLTDFEKFCVDEYLYAANPKYAHLYPRDYDDCRYWPKQRLQEEPLRKVLIHFQVFWRDLVSYGELEVSPYDAYVPWMQEKKYKRYSELIGDPLTLTMEEFQLVISTPVPESMAPARNAFILQCCLGCRGEDFRNLTMKNISVSKEGIPYIIYKHKAVRKKEKLEYEYEIRVPLVRIAFDIVMRQRFEFFFGVYNASYNRKLQLFLRHCGITREVCLLNTRTNDTEYVPLCDAVTQGGVHRMHMDLLYESEDLRGVRGGWYNGAKKMTRYSLLPVKEYFKKLNDALGQMPYKVDQNLNIIAGSPFVAQDVYTYKEQPDKLPGGRTNPYLISALVEKPAGEGLVSERVEVRYGCTLPRERSVVLGGKKYAEFLESLEEGDRQQIQYGLMLLKKVSDFRLTFVRDLGDTVYVFRTEVRDKVYNSFFYLNGDTIVLLQGAPEMKRKRRKVSKEKEDYSPLKELRWKHVLGELPSREYDSALDELYGASGSVKREVFEMRACSSYVSQTIRKARLDAGVSVASVAKHLGINYKTRRLSRLSRVEDGSRVLPFKYLANYLEAIGMKAIVTRPGLNGWNEYSLTHTREQMLEAIGEPVYRYHRKEPAKEE